MEILAAGLFLLVFREQAAVPRSMIVHMARTARFCTAHSPNGLARPNGYDDDQYRRSAVQYMYTYFQL